ncbi:MAG: radical SAM protein [Thermoplasmata archaeon]|nr:radical SAM protein [Euryarchaeota archaeon]RLF65422.1 MAG: radical SAM protein [Thermoplasmata archaeon]
MRIQNIRVRSILNSSYIADYTINPYVGCSHACVYCYADYYTRRIYGVREPWGDYVYIKENALELLKNEIKYKDPGNIYFSSLTDAYQPIENTRKLTRKLMEFLAEYDWPIIIQTKSALVTRDIDILSRFSDITVGFTIITPRESIRAMLEPRASPVKARIESLRRIKDAGMKTFVFIGPIMPGTEIVDIKELIENTIEFSDIYYFDKLNVKPYTWQSMEKKLPRFVVDNYKAFMASNYYLWLKERLKDLAKDLGIKYEILF